MSKDIVVFTLHKSASMFIHQQCELLCGLCDMPYHSPNIPGSGINARKLLTDKSLWDTHHGCIAPIRFFVDLPREADYNIILHLRDPRDVLVSMFYSYCYIHPGEVAANTGYRQDVAARGIDAFVLTKAIGGNDMVGDYGTGGHVEDLIGNLAQRYRDYTKHFIGKPNVTLVKYEEMVGDYRSWLNKFTAPWPLTDRTRIIESLVAQSATFFPRRFQDVMTHVRHVTPGDYKLKLKTSTIDKLNDIFSDTLKTLRST